jgi:hypothetical protein
MRAFGKSNGGGRRNAPRALAPLPAIFMTIGRTDKAAVIDISCTGARLRGRSLPPRGEEMELKVEEVRVFGIVAWAEDDECGVAFDAPLMPFEVDRLRRKAGIPRLAAISVDDRLVLESWLTGESH